MIDLDSPLVSFPDELFECVWPFCGLGLKGLINLIIRLMQYCYVFEVVSSGLGKILEEVS